MAPTHGTISEAERTQFKNDGHLTLDTGIPEHVLDQAIEDFEGYWKGQESWGVPYADAGRVQDGWGVSVACFKIATHPRVLAVLQQLFDREPRPFQTLNFPCGTEQKAHSDTIHFNSEPFGLMCGVWVALEDVEYDQGPLVYYPGSQKLPDTTYQDIGVEPDPRNYSQYADYVQSQIEKCVLEPSYGLVKKGQAIIWAANLLHGGSARLDSTKSRHSQVTHYYFEGAKPWRPVYSTLERVYFEPDWITAKQAYLRLWQLPKSHWRDRARRIFDGGQTYGPFWTERNPGENGSSFRGV